MELKISSIYEVYFSLKIVTMNEDFYGPKKEIFEAFKKKFRAWES